MKVWVEVVSLNADGEEQRRQVLTIERRELTMETLDMNDAANGSCPAATAAETGAVSDDQANESQWHEGKPNREATWPMSTAHRQIDPARRPAGKEPDAAAPGNARIVPRLFTSALGGGLSARAHAIGGDPF
jgi:hypothetical protein